MGDRAQLRITNGEQSFYLYTHWAGSELTSILREGLQRAIDVGRAVSDKGDVSYGLTAVVKQFLDESYDPERGIGAGFGFVPTDNDGDYRILELRVGRYGAEDPDMDWTVEYDGNRITIERFLSSRNTDADLNWS